MNIFVWALAKLAAQRKMPPHIGALITIYSSTAIIYAPLTLIGVATTIYGLWGADAVHAWLPWFTFWHLLGGMVLFILIMMVVFHKIVLPSIYAFQVQQQYRHQNPLVTDMKEALNKLGEMEKKLTEVSERLEKLEAKK